MFSAPSEGNLARFGAAASSNPVNTPKVEASFRDELTKTLASGFTTEEVAGAKKAIRDQRMTIIIATHRLSLLTMVDRLLLFDNGRLVADGPRDKVLSILQAKPVAPAPAPLQQDAIQPESA